MEHGLIFALNSTICSESSKTYIGTGKILRILGNWAFFSCENTCSLKFSKQGDEIH